MPKVKIINENGVLKGIDTNGNEVPIEIDDLDANLVTADQEVINQRFEHDFSSDWPHWPNVPEQGGFQFARPHPGVDNPVITASSVTDNTANGVSDPFIAVGDNGKLYIFAEIIPGDTDTDIGRWSSWDGVSWSFDETVFKTSTHLSYPNLFGRYSGTNYMAVPVGDSSTDSKLYKADDIESSSWTEVGTIVSGVGEPTPFFHDDRWWILTADGGGSNTRLYYADSTGLDPEHLTSVTQHTDSTITSVGKPGGRAWIHNGHVMYPTHSVTLVRVANITTSTGVQANELARSVIGLEDNDEWNDSNMHHYCPLIAGHGQAPLIAVDGADSSDDFSIGIYTSSDQAPSIAKALLSSNQSVAGDGAFDDVTYDEIVYDTPNRYDPSNNHYTVPAFGYYRVKATVRLVVGTGDSSSTPYTAKLRIRNILNGGGSTDWAETVKQIDEADGDKVTIQVEGAEVGHKDDQLIVQFSQDSGGSEDLSGSSGAPHVSHVEVERIW